MSLKGADVMQRKFKIKWPNVVENHYSESDCAPDFI